MVKNITKFLYPHQHCDDLISSVTQSCFTCGVGGNTGVVNCFGLGGEILKSASLHVCSAPYLANHILNLISASFHYLKRVCFTLAADTEEELWLKAALSL